MSRRTRLFCWQSFLFNGTGSLHTWGPRAHAVTHPSAPQRATYYRLTEFYHARTGALACTIDTRWVLVDTNTKRILRKAPDALPIPFTLPPRQETKLELLKADTAPVGQVTAGFSRCDVNGHLNNTQYADILCDYVPAGQMKKRDIRRLVLAYHREVPMGHSFALNRGEVENGYYFVGESDGVEHFEANVLWGIRPWLAWGQLLVPVDSLACLVRGLALKKGQDVVLLSQNLYKLMTKCP